ncbi:SUKH-4 family immunity protein, partial [Streptomyces sp. T-3]|nr:SUKH-4 family immunity protein [Streptomyces sp. T-3]
PADAVGALTRWGVPVLPAGPSGSSTIAGDVQQEPEPQLVARGITAYRLGSYFGRPIGASPGGGTVYGLPEEEHFSVPLINTSVPAFVEIAWRLHFTTQALIPLDEAEEYEQLERNLQRFCDWIHELDPGCKPQGRASWWDGIAGSW